MLPLSFKIVSVKEWATDSWVIKFRNDFIVLSKICSVIDGQSDISITFSIWALCFMKLSNSMS